MSGKGSPNSFSDAFNILNGAASPGKTPHNISREESTATTIYDEKRGAIGRNGSGHSGHGDGTNAPTIVPIEVDQRLDPGKVYMRWDHNDSRRSLQDDYDYSRKVLRVTNPE